MNRDYLGYRFDVGRTFLYKNGRCGDLKGQGSAVAVIDSAADNMGCDIGVVVLAGTNSV